MNLKRTATIVVVGGALLAWLAGAATSNRETDPTATVVRLPAIDMRGAELAAEVARLHERLRPNATPTVPGRNVFSFRSAPVRSVPPPMPAPALVETPTVVALPPLKLAGVAEDADGDAAVRTAIITGPGQLFMVKEGENVTARYRVAKISADVVELLDLGDGTTRRLALR